MCQNDFHTFILQSHYPNRRSPDGWWAKNSKIGRRRPIVGRRRHRFWQIFWSADDFFVEAPKLKVSLTDPPIFMGFVIGEASGDGRLMIGRQSADILKIFSSWYRPTVARSSGVNRPTIARRSVDDILSQNRRQPDAGYRPSFGRWSPDCRPIINFGLCYIVNNACIHINYEIYHAFILFWDSFHLTSCTSNICFLCWISNWTLRMTSTSKRLQHNSGHSLIYDYCNRILNILECTCMWINLSVWSFDIKVSTSSNFNNDSKHSPIYVALLEHQTHNLTIEMCA